MKIRNGFVSNSSSSSFIIGVGEITDLNKFTVYCKNHGFSDYEILNYDQVIESYMFNSDKQNIVVQSYTGDNVDMTVETDKTYVVIDINNNEGDSAFCDDYDDICSDICYDINEDFFDKDQQAVFNINESVGVKKFNYTFGAGRNG